MSRLLTSLGFRVVILSLASTATIALAEEGPKGFASVMFLTDVSAISYTIENEPFADWLKPVIAAVEARFPKQKGRKSIVVQITLRHDGPAEIELAGNPRLSEEDVAAIRAAADARKAPRTKVSTCSLRVVARDVEGNPGALPGLTPALKSPHEQLLDRVRSAPTREGLALLRRWATDESLPLLAAAAKDAEEKYAAVRKLGDALAKALANPRTAPDVEALATKNPDFWRATLEMAPGNPLTPAVECSLLLANGRVEWAQQVAAMADIFDGEKSAPSAQLDFGRALGQAYLEGVNRRVRAGIALHDAGKFTEALAAFDAVLKDDPQSSWAIYERFHTGRAMKMKSGGDVGSFSAELWPAARARILASNPLYKSMAQADGREGYFDLTRRLAIAELFKDQDALARDVVAYADIALDLGAFDMAAMLYWSILTRVEPKEYNDRPLLESFLYALERLGVKDIKTNFKGDHAAAFAAIEADRRKRLKATPGMEKIEDAPAEPKPAPEKP